MEGNRRRTTESSSKPDIPGIFRSERIMSGISFLMASNAEKPFGATRTAYPRAVNMIDRFPQIDASSSTTRRLAFTWYIVHLRDGI
jgi:hypothetical protein